MSISIKIDGKTYDVPEGGRLIDVCHDVGIEIPHFCYHPGLGPDGNCRMCQVELITGRGPILAISCKTTVTDGMEVVTSSERIKQVRASVEEFLLLDHPLDCPICDKAGECTLQDYYYEYDLQDSRMKFPREKKRKAIVLGETLVLDQERCILCNRCVRFLSDIAGKEELFIAGRGHESYLTTFPGREVTSPYSLNTVDLCPVGALTSRDFRFSSPTWFLSRSPSVCNTCSRGCNIEIDHKSGKIHRLRPRHNESVNSYWMCDEGRLNYKFVNENRLKEFKVTRGGKKVAASSETAVREILSALRPAGSGTPGSSSEAAAGEILILASLTCTIEELFLLKKLNGILTAANLYAVRHVPDGEEDNILRKADRHPNLKSAELLELSIVDLREDGAGTGMSDIEGILSRGCTLLCVGFNYGISKALLDVFSRARTAIIAAACETPLMDKATIVVPALTFSEKEGLVINFQGHIQRLHTALAPQGESMNEWKLVNNLISMLDASKSFENITEVRRAVREEESAFAGVDLNAIGLTGVRIESLPIG
ncbi:MAG: 2Fe-2S iron-sulfur cluster binding domain-containing protein [Candidatus Latescibacteria bacterium]|nr:2Fe-2S iron-sulfur cluster binding domain-containing protein [Candidatus Latescibacterota bacterium]NIM22000.1 2Fe-2S iron-sulfur cluster binding domain-containing protein [Candidatus Latescibacterota bacterium]NIM66018.1 2Fe-2S iron-sulfur cluster binding domain-containing protein [Candidatus Latescibacterota bacterium]NIO02426.1 2Fe-2S iron-sulfur cluster binding domain-containing protein [Candidatus Latescibacterota bacterium]NIO29337.1 2Fe-2S iron-sulfur cluster binding domain-containing